MGRLDGKVAIITGGARGQGAEEGRLFASEGATVVLADVLDDLGQETAAKIQGARYLHLDVRSESEWQATVDAVVARHGRIDVLVNNAAIDLAKRFEQTTLEEFERIVSINQTGVFLGMRTVARAMMAANRGGSIVNISSVAGLEGVKGRAAYGSTKWAVRGMTKTAALEWGDRGIRVNSIHPGIIETPMTANLRAFTDADVRAKTERNIPLGRVGQPIDIANMALFLASDESAYCTGQEFTVDGGIHH
ncbi:MAG TPA: glucose 1-dehydrogenase [Pseudomonadales bacterium]|nr:glucose 1-dehydrogenase [Pseudomonadales bacterium]